MYEIIGWLVALVFFVILEGATAGVVSIWFAGGAAVAALLAGIGLSLPVQIAAFFACSILLLLLLRPLAKRWAAPAPARTNVDRNIGVEALVTETIDPLRNTGAVKLGGTEWSARSEDNRIIPEGSLVRTERIEGVYIYVTLVEAVPEALSEEKARQAFWR